MRGAACMLLLLAAAATPSAAWHHGRATFYGNGDGYSIHHGSCQFGQLDNHDIAAFSDTDPEFSGSCGSCYEVACEEGRLTDGYGKTLDRHGACKGGASVVVRITDSCPCNYPANYYSNKRWCCGDMRHMDLSWAAFEKIADTGKGVVGIKFRRVACDTHRPLDGSSPSASGSASASSSDSSSSDSSSSSSSSSSGGGWEGSKAQYGR
ncbi:MAG: expansin [Monoraphidium minutum]|nr:MAG: expansin [Monoraphidium minutum]